MDNEYLEGWLRGVRLCHISHSKAAAHDSRMHKVLGIPVVIVTAVVGTTVFASIGRSPHIALAIITGMLSISAAVLSSLQTFLSYSSSAERHKFAAIKYGMLRRELEQNLCDPAPSEESSREFANTFRARWDSVDQES